jgi:uncharacterized protein (DUF1697 family)
MERYVAFLRGINVSGQKIIKMETLRAVLAGAGFAEVKTYIQSGNVLFDSETHDTHLISSLIENLIEESFGFRTDVILRKYSEIKALADSPLFIKLKMDEGTKYYITFLKEKYPEPLVLPLFSKNRDVEIIHQSEMDMISVSTLFKGNYGFPNSFIEKLTGIAASTRNPNTLEKILAMDN